MYPDTDGDQDRPSKGIHGYDAKYVDEMKGIMYATGPDIRDGQVIASLKQVDHYNIFCQLLGIPAKANNGSLEIVHSVLSRYEQTSEEGEDEEDSDEDDSDEENGVLGLTASPWTVCLFSSLVIPFYV